MGGEGKGQCSGRAPGPVSHRPPLPSPPPSLCFQSKRRFERDCKEADRAQQYFEKMDADINVTKADVEKVR